ncbi:hypothetical protein FIBSPDRAFT_957240 [Athelia psychrophila]|uniref:Uncharacterized protein n=1 Tax=Athelia psychrophila TaxID=1759441 RepID=A0A166G3D9_9AGAM|nr:hypothetical protein FIBSPDRAFT_957240 [Fibularhizoctonia sp. CBS 109695]
MSTNTRQEPTFDLARATYKAAQTTVWLHALIGDASQPTTRKQEAVHYVIMYIYVLFRASGQSLVVPDWLEPLWQLWSSGRMAKPQTMVQPEDIARLAGNALDLALDTVPIAPPGEAAYLQLSPELLQLMTDYPIDVLGLPAAPVPEPEDVSMAEPDKSRIKKEETGSSRDRDSHDADIPRTSGARRGAGSGSSRAAARKSAERTLTAPETRQATFKTKLETMLGNLAGAYDTKLIDQSGGCEQCTRKRVDCHIPRDGAKLAGQLIMWNSCCECNIGKTGCSFVPTPAKSALKTSSISMSRSHSQGSSKLPVQQPEAPKSPDDAEGSESSAGALSTGNHYESLKPFTHDDGKKMLAAVQQSVREIVRDAVNTSHSTMVEELTRKHNALMQENALLRELYQSEATAHRTSMDNVTRLLQVMVKMTADEGEA